LIHLTTKAFLASESITHARKDKHATLQLQIQIEAKEYGVQVLITKGLIDTVVTNKNGGPDSQQKNLALQWI
jgi:hypothetical protein